MTEDRRPYMRLGKIKKVRVGMGGYQDAMMGVWFTLGGESWVTHDGVGTWADRSEGAKWTEEDRDKVYAEAMHKIRNLLSYAGREVQDLEGLPIEATFEGNSLKSWRLLTEVL